MNNNSLPLCGTRNPEFVSGVNADLPAADSERVKLLMEECLAGRGGELDLASKVATTPGN